MSDADDIVDAEFVEVVDPSGKARRVRVNPVKEGLFSGIAKDMEDIEHQVNAVLDLAQEAKEHVPRIAGTAKRLWGRISDYQINDRKPMKR